MPFRAGEGEFGVSLVFHASGGLGLDMPTPVWSEMPGRPMNSPKLARALAIAAGAGGLFPGAMRLAGQKPTREPNGCNLRVVPLKTARKALPLVVQRTALPLYVVYVGLPCFQLPF